MAGESDRFLIQMHIPNVAMVNGQGAQSHWEGGMQMKFNRIMEKYQDRILHQLVAHEHRADIRLMRKEEFKGQPMLCIEESRQKNEFFMTQFIAPSMSPNQFNEAGFMTFKYQNKDLIDIKLTFQKVSQTYGLPRDSIIQPPFKVNLSQKYGL